MCLYQEENEASIETVGLIRNTDIQWDWGGGSNSERRFLEGRNLGIC